MRPLRALFGRLRRRFAGKQKVRAGRMVADVVRHRPHDGQPVDALRELRKVFADLNAWNIRGDRLKCAANFRGRVGLHVPSVLMGRPAPHEEQDTRLGAPETVPGRRRASHQQIRKRQAEQARCAGAEKITPAAPLRRLIFDCARHERIFLR